ncbi:Sphingosine kinase 1 [Glycine soja]
MNLRLNCLQFRNLDPWVQFCAATLMGKKEKTCNKISRGSSSKMRGSSDTDDTDDNAILTRYRTSVTWPSFSAGQAHETTCASNRGYVVSLVIVTCMLLPPLFLQPRLVGFGSKRPNPPEIEFSIIWSISDRFIIGLVWARVKRDVLGIVACGPYIKIKSLVETRDGCFISSSPARLVRNDVVFMPSSEESPRLWCQKLGEFIDSLGRPKSLLVFVNPFGGKQSAKKIFAEQVKSLLEDAQIQITVQETKHELHAKEVARSLDITKYHGIVCVSGDGILVEVVNGLLQREDWDTAIKMPLGVVPAGNGMAKSLLDSVGDPCEVANAVLAIIRGSKRPLDVATIT